MAQVDLYSDAHLHISLKHFVNGRKGLLERIPYVDGIQLSGRSTGLNYDQSDVITLREGNVSLALAALYPLESFVHKSWIAENAIAKIFFGFRTKRVKQLFRNFPNGFDRLIGEYSYILNDQGSLPPDVLLVKNKEDMDVQGKTKIVLTIEGGHALMAAQHPISNRKGFEKEVLANLDKIRQWDHPVFSLNLAHFEYNHLAGSSWAIPIPKSLQLIVRETMERLENDDPGLTSSGRKVIDHCLDVTDTRHRIWIDLKHTHVRARFDIYDHYEQGYNTQGGIEVNGKKVPVPIIASHVGVSGMVDLTSALSVNDRAREAKEKKYGRFNPLDINLCDEELVLLYRSGGMVGISMDQRILGAGNDEHKREIKKRLRGLRDKETGKRIPWKRVWHSVLFIDNLVHILKVLFEDIRANGIPSHGLDPWDVICIGSDFDGIIDPLDTCPTARHFGDFEKELNIYFRDYIDKKDMELIGDPDGSTIKMILRKVFHSNLERFVKEYFPA